MTYIQVAKRAPKKTIRITEEQQAELLKDEYPTRKMRLEEILEALAKGEK